MMLEESCFVLPPLMYAALQGHARVEAWEDAQATSRFTPRRRSAAMAVVSMVPPSRVKKSSLEPLDLPRCLLNPKP